MKFFKTCLLLLVLCFALLEGAFGRRVRHRRHRRSLGEAFQNFFLGFLDGLVGAEVAGLKNCLNIPAIISGESDPVPKPDENKIQDDKSSGFFTHLKTFLGIGLRIVCLFKGKVSTAITDTLKRRRRMFRLFFQGRKGFWDSVVNFFTNFGKKVVNGVKKIGTWVKAEYDELKLAIKNLVTPITEYFIKLWGRIKNWIMGTWVGKIITFFQQQSVKTCIAPLVGIASLVASVISFAALVGSTAGIGLVVQLLMGLICKWETFKKAIDLFIEARALQPGNPKHHKWGEFAGTLVKGLI